MSESAVQPWKVRNTEHMAVTTEPALAGARDQAVAGLRAAIVAHSQAPASWPIRTR